MSWSQPAYETIARLVSVRTGLAFPPARSESIEMGIRRAMARAGLSDLSRYGALLAEDGNVLDDLIVELTVGETYFFREPGQFEFLRREVLPEIRRRRGLQHGIRAWSAGCASGEEAYSLAVLFMQEGLLEGTHVLATDISRTALAKARNGVYSDWSLRGPGAPAMQPYLTRQGNHYLLDERVRRRVLFEYLNLALDVYPSFATGTWGMDLILCRNVLIYFDPETVQSVARRLFEALAEGGWLITASSDPPLADKAPYVTVVAEEGVFYRRGAHLPSPSAPHWVLPPVLVLPGSGAKGMGPEDKAGPELRDGEPVLTRTPEDAGPSAPRLADLLGEAQKAFVQGDYSRVVQLTRDYAHDAAAAALHIRALANLETADAECACAEATARHPLSAELSYLHAVLLLDLGREEEAIRALRRVIYLDRNLAIAQLTLGSVLRQRGDVAGARRAYRNARNLCTACPPDQVVPLADGEPAGRLAEVAANQLALLDSLEVTP